MRDRVRDSASALNNSPAGAPYNLDRVLEIGFARYADRPARYRIEGDIPEAAAGDDDSGRKLLEGAAVINVTPSILETAKTGVGHQPDVARVRALDDDDVTFVQVLALVNEFHGISNRLSEKLMMITPALKGTQYRFRQT